MPFPNRPPRGNGIPVWGLRMGHSFPNGLVWESVSRNLALKWDAGSQCSLKRKIHPGMTHRNGMQLPNGHATGKLIPKSASRVGRAFRMSLDWETPSRSHQKTGGPDTVRAARSVRHIERLLACYVIPNDVVAVGENVVAAGRHGRRAVDRVHPTARAAILLLGQTADRGDIRAVR